MEGNQLTFFVTYMDREAVLTLSEFDTVGQLIQELELTFDVEIVTDDINGWDVRPFGDDAILKVCCLQDFNCLQVNKLNTFEMERSMEYDSLNTDSFDPEVAATIQLKPKVPNSFRLRELKFENAVSIACDSFDKKIALLLYLHNSDDIFCRKFLTYIQDEEIKSILDDSFLVMGWDLENNRLHDGLTRAMSAYPQLSFVNQWIPAKIGAAVCLLPSDDKDLAVIFGMKGDISSESLKESLRMVSILCLENSAPSDDIPGVSADNSHESEIEAIKSLKRKLSPNISVTLRYFTLDDALDFICSASFNEKKALLLYLHNSEHPFSQMFSSNLETGELPQILNRSFLILGWDVENPAYHNALVRALNRHISLAVVSDLVTNKNSVGLCILPVRDTIKVYFCLRGKLSVKDAIKGLKEVETAFKLEIEKERELKKIEDETSTKNELDSEKLQSLWADMLGDRDYDSFEYDQHDLLKKKIGFALCGPPQNEYGYDKEVLKKVDELYSIIKKQSSEIAVFRDHIEVAFIYNCLEPLPSEKIKKAKKKPDYNPKVDVSVFPVFILRKCRGSSNPCRVFIDDNGRTYTSWQEFVIKNKYPECEMIVPLDGRYTVLDGEVLLERHLSPACQLDYKLLQVGDVVSGAAGLASGAVFITAAAGITALPVAPIALGIAGVVGAASGVWAIGRSAYTLYDRNKHKESMSLANSEARGAYLNVVAGSLGFVGAGANMALTQLVSNGVVIGKSTTYTVNAIQVLNVSAGGASLVNSGYEVIDQWINKNQPPSALTILQLGSSVLFFGHAVYNCKGAQTIVDETQARVLQDYQDSLRSNRHRKTFNRMMKETMNTHGDGTRARAEVIKTIRNIPNKDEVFAALTRNTKRLSKAGIKYSAEGGQITLGGMAVDMNEFIGLNSNQAETFFNNISQQSALERSGINPSSSTASGTSIDLKNAISGMLNDLKSDASAMNVNRFLLLTEKLLVFCSADTKTKVVYAVHQTVSYIHRKLARNVIDEIDEVIPINTQLFEFLRPVMSFFSKKVDEFEQKYQRYQETKHVDDYDPLFDVVNPVYAKRAVTFFEFVVRNSFNGRTLVENVLNEISEYVTAWVTRKIFELTESRERERSRDIHSAGFRPRKISCLMCGGYYYNSSP